jgi:hypothetical protein
MAYFHKLGDINWTRFAVAIGAVIIFWSGMQEIVPEKWHHVVEVFLAALNGAIIFTLRSGNPRNPSSRTRLSDSTIERLKGGTGDHV